MPILVIVSCVVSGIIAVVVSNLSEVEAHSESDKYLGWVVPAFLFKFFIFVLLCLALIVLGSVEVHYRTLAAENETLKKALIASGVAEMVPVTFEFKLKAEK